MARRKQNIDAYGKSWSPIDIPNLEKAVKLYERLNYLQDHFAGSLSGANKIMAQINEQAEIKEELEKTGIKLTEEQIKKVLELFKIRQQENKLAEQGIKGSTSGILNYKPTTSPYGSPTNYYKPEYTNGQVNSGNLGNAVASGIMNRKMVQSEVQRMKDAGSIMSEASLKRAAQINVQNGNAVMTDEMKKFGGKMNTVGSLFQVAVNTFSEAVKTFSGLFFKGLNNQANVYEQTFTNISVRTGTTRSQYFQNQTASASNLYSKGLAGNIANSEIQKMWNSLADIGMNQEQMFTRALDNVLTNKIVPYLDTSSQSLNILNERVDGRFVKDIRGINRINNEIAGNNYTTQEMLQTMIDEMQPMSDAAIEELAQGSVEVTSMINDMINAGWSPDAAKSYATQLFKAQKYGDQIMRSGSVTEKKTLVDAIGNGVNIYDPTQFNDYMALAAGNTSFFANMGPGYTSTLGGVIQNAIGSAVGEDYGRQMGALNGKKSAAQIKLETDTTAEAVKKAAEEATEDYTNDVNNTLKQIQSNELENASTWLAAIYEQIGYWGDILAVLVKGIAGVVGAKILGSTAKGLLGLGSKSGGGLAAGLGWHGAKAGVTGALGVGTAVAGVAGTAYGAYKTYEYGSQYAKSGKGTDLGAAVTAGVGTAAIAGGAITALTASGPIGWAIMAVGALGLVAADLIEDLGHDGDIMEELNAASENRLKDFREQHYEERKQLKEFRDDISQLDDVSEIQKKLIDEGIATQEELQDAMYDDKNALIALTDQFIASKAELDNTGEALLREIENNQNAKQNDISKDMWELSKKKVGDMTDEEKAAIGDFMEDYYYWMKKKADQGDKDAKYRIDEWEKYGNNLTDHIVSQDDLNAINSLNTLHYGGNDDTYNLYKQFMADEGNVKTITQSTNVQKYLGLDKSFSRSDYSQAINYIEQAILSKNEDSRKSLLKQAKALGLTWEVLGKYEQGRNYQNRLKEVGINSYKTGLPYVPYDDYLANLHEGEAVLTASTANELRNLIATYRESQQTDVNLDTAIQAQTTALVNKMDEILGTINQMNSPFKPVTDNTSSIFNNMKYMRSTKSFNSK